MTKRARPAWIVLAALLCTGLANPGAVGASFAEIHGLGGRAMAMGGAYVAVADDYTCMFYNPGGLTQIRGNEASFCYILSAPRVSLSKGGSESGTYLHDNIGIPVLGMVLDLSRVFKLKRRISLGMTGVFPDNFQSGYMVRYGTNFDPYFPIYGDCHEDRRISLIFGPSVEITDWLSAGIGVAFIVHGQYVNIPLYYTLDGELIHDRWDLRMDVSTEISPIVGLLFRPSEKLRIGAVWRKKIEFLIADAMITTMTAVVLPGFEIPVTVRIPVSAHFTPEQYALGVSYRFTDTLLVAADVTFYDWRAYLDNAGSELDPPLEATIVPRIGVEYGLPGGWVARAGYGYVPSPLKQQTASVSINYIDSDCHVFSLGAGYLLEIPRILRHPVDIRAFVQYRHLVERSFANVHTGGEDLVCGGYYLNSGLELRFAF
ncbi:OmpP1/FadL family transporter [Thermodesulfobacteriota bacterium]